MLNRSRSWPVQSVVTLDPRGIVYSKIQTRTPDIVLEVNERAWTRPDIFPDVKTDGETTKDNEPLQIRFIDHYKLLDSVATRRDKEFEVTVPPTRALPVDISVIATANEDSKLLSSYQIDLLRKKSCKARNEEPLVQRKSLERKLTTEFESVASNDTKITDCDLKKNITQESKLSHQIIRSYSLGHEQAEQKLNRTFKKFSLPTPQLKDIADNAEEGGVKGKTNVDVKKVSTLTRHYYPEGGWGFVVVTCSVIVNVLCHGLQLASGIIMVKSALKFKIDVIHAGGINRLVSAKNERQYCYEEMQERNLKRSDSYLLDSGVGAESADAPSCCDLHIRCERNEQRVPDPVLACNNTIRQHYYPEGGWGWLIVICGVVVQCLNNGLQTSWGIIDVQIRRKFSHIHPNDTGWLGALSTAVALLLSPITIAFCRRKSTRVTAVVGGLVTALGCLFTSFASQFHQLFFSYGTVIGIGVGLTRDCSTLMVAQYFKRRRELVEIFIVSGSGLGISVMSACIQGAINAIGWRLGLQAITGAVFLTFILGMFYRSASLYHPQRRAILHLKNQKRKIKDKNKVDDKPAFLDTSTLRSKTVRILLASTSLSAFGINTPIFYLAHQAQEEGLGERVVLLQAYLGLAWVLGCASFGLVVVHNSVECRIARQYLCQAAIFMCGLSILALTTVHGNYHGYVLFVWIYGIFCGAYHYSLKMYTYERVRARNFARTWGFVQCSQAIPIALGVPISGYLNKGCGGKAGYYFSSTCTLAGSIAMFLIDIHKRRIARHKHTRENGQKHLCESETCPRRRPSLGAEPEPEPVQVHDLPVAELIPGLAPDKPELTCISEEGIADMDLPDNLLDDFDYIGITSCNKVENYLMLSEFENNLIAETPVVMDKRGRRWSLSRRFEDVPEEGGRWRLVPPKRTITVIDEASV